MMHSIASALAILFYLAASAYQGRYLLRRAPARSDQALLEPDPSLPRRTVFLVLAGIGLVAHGISIFGTLVTEHGVDLGFYRVSSLIFWFICLIGLADTLRRPLQNSMALLLPLAALSILLALLFRSPGVALARLEPGVVAHILVSILAYAVLTLCAIHAILLAMQEHALKRRPVNRLLEVLPPLQTMEAMLFELLWTGMALLSLAILLGVVYIDDLFAQHLVHKTVFSLLAWLIFAILLWGHHQLGWRGPVAVRWTLGGFAALMLAYFGTKMVLELILHRT
ncbi:MAG: cytochrome c biogenesis protein CcsA [Spongiibacteraceae bacterium]|jgi:ABC-type uncharacterized transport system permease subunit|nr:cytochrome c biogenesis protein CcsA [Spongiibacteraceae bacterium]